MKSREFEGEVVEGVFRPDFDYCLSEAFPWLSYFYTFPLSKKKKSPQPKNGGICLHTPPGWTPLPFRLSAEPVVSTFAINRFNDAIDIFSGNSCKHFLAP